MTVAKFRVWADVDERPHYDYVQKLVEEQRIPRPTDLVRGRAGPAALGAARRAGAAAGAVAGHERRPLRLADVDSEGGGAAGPVQAAGAGVRIGDLPALLERFADGVVPQEWVRRVLEVTWIDIATDVLALGLLAAGTAALVHCRREWRAWFLALPLLAAVALIVALYVLTGTDSFYLRYVYAALLPFALGAGIGLTRGAVTRLHVGTLLTATLVVGALWCTSPASSGSTTPHSQAG